MKNISFLITFFVFGLAACFVYGQSVTTEAPVLDWGLLWSGSWEGKTSEELFPPVLAGTLHNRGELKLHLLPLNLILRAQALDRRPLNIEPETFSWEALLGDPDKTITHFLGGLYHKPTGSRLLFGVLDEWGLSARIRNPWIRSPPYPENHKPLMADLKTAASSTKEDEVYLYLSSPYLEPIPRIKLRGFFSTQTEMEEIINGQGISTFSGGLDFSFAKKTGLLLETFYTGKTLPPKKASVWFSSPPSLPEREFHLFAGGLLFTNPAFSVSSDFAFSQTFAWGEDIYCNLGFTLTPLLPFAPKNRQRPLAVSLAVDGAGERFVNRDGVNLNEGIRGAAKIELKGRYNSLLRVNSTLRGPGLGEELNRSSTGFYYRFPSRSNSDFPVRLTRISLSADRNAENPLKIKDGFSGTIGLNVNLFNQKSDTQKKNLLAGSPLGVTFSGSVSGFDFAEESWNWDVASVNCDLYWSPLNFQFRSRVGTTFFAEKEEKWDFSFSAAMRFKQGRLNIKAASPDFPDKWNWTFTWRVEKK